MPPNGNNLNLKRRKTYFTP